MARIVLTADYTLMTNFRDLPLATFFSCIPTDFALSRFAFSVLAPNPPHDGGVAQWAPYGLRKIEASLLASKRFKRKEIVVAHPYHVRNFIGPETQVVGVYAMDPLGLGPVSMSFTNGGTLTPYTRFMFEKLMHEIKMPTWIRENGHRRNYKTVVGGAGVWHFEYRPAKVEELGIDHIVVGEADHCAADILEDVMNGTAPFKIEPERPPMLTEIPPIVAPSMHGMIEVMRGCGRGCQFCEVTLRRPRYMSPEYIAKEVELNVKYGGHTNAWIHSDDVFLYKVEDWKKMIPNEEAILEMARAVMSVPGIRSANPTHGTVSAVAANPGMVAKLTELFRGSEHHFVGIQCGLETGSRELSRKIMPRKALPFRPEEWPEVILEGTRVLNENHWFPAYTLILGLPGETPEDAWDTCRLLERMEQLPNNHYITAPLSFVPIGVLRGEEFYNTDEMIDEARFNVYYRAWRHILSEMDEDLWRVSRMPFPVKAVINGLGRLGGRYILRHLERFGERKGFRVKPVAM